MPLVSLLGSHLAEITTQFAHDVGHGFSYRRCEKITGLNFCGFKPTEIFADILSRFLSQKCLLLKSGTYIHGKTFTVLLKTTKTVKV